MTFQTDSKAMITPKSFQFIACQISKFMSELKTFLRPI